MVMVFVVGVAAPASRLATGPTAVPPLFKNCTALNKKYPHGVGKAKARDKTSGERVTTFKRNTALYNRAMSYNKRLDGDKDGIACEKA
jgi:excalibur calcium-binding domain-containing protein